MTATALAVSDLDERIVEAFRDGAKSTDVMNLIKEAETAAAALGDAAGRSRTRALDPVLAPSEVAVARREMEDAAFRRDRLQAAVQRLGDRLKELQWREENQRRQVAYDRVKGERDALAGRKIFSRRERSDWRAIRPGPRHRTRSRTCDARPVR